MSDSAARCRRFDPGLSKNLVLTAELRPRSLILSFCLPSAANC